jgi:large subunit ribosomal protein L18
MAKHKLSRIAYRRKREGKTDYKRRLKLLKSRKLRLVVRKTNKHIIAQLIRYTPDGDRVLVGLSSASLKKLGWDLSTKSIPASYLTGLLLGKNALEKKFQEAILDLGLITPIKGSKIFAVVKGAQEAGLKISVAKETFPIKDRIQGKHIASYYGSNPNRFPRYQKQNLKSENIESKIILVKNKILTNKTK